MLGFVRVASIQQVIDDSGVRKFLACLCRVYRARVTSAHGNRPAAEIDHKINLHLLCPIFFLLAHVRKEIVDIRIKVEGRKVDRR